MERLKDSWMTGADQKLSWFLAQLKPNCARIAETNLNRQSIRTFLPMEDTPTGATDVS